MTIWYDPNPAIGTWKTPVSYKLLPETDQSGFQRLLLDYNGEQHTLRNVIRPDQVFFVERAMHVLRDLAEHGPDKKKEEDKPVPWYLSLWKPPEVDGRIELRRNLFRYAEDMLVWMVLRERMDSPIIAQFGDKESNLTMPLVPVLAKWRFIDLDLHRKPIPILLKMGSRRHYGPFPTVLENDLPWNRKKDMAIFRGMMSGHDLETNKFAQSLLGMPNLTYSQACRRISRCRFVYNHFNSSLVDARLNYVFDKFTELDNRTMVEKKMDISAQLKYKMIVSLEGNDVASGLKWALLSNSVVLMPPPTKTTWALEAWLEPWVHYVPLSPELENGDEMVRWVLNHETEAQRIAERATNWIHDLFLHPDAEKDHIETLRGIAVRYTNLWN